MLVMLGESILNESSRGPQQINRLYYQFLTKRLGSGFMYHGYSSGLRSKVAFALYLPIFIIRWRQAQFLVNSNSPFLLLYLQLLKAVLRFGLVVVIHGSAQLEAEFYFERRKALVSATEKLALRLTKSVITVSNLYAAKLRPLLSRNCKISVVHNCIGETLLTPWSDKLRTANKPISIMYNGGIDRQKGFFKLSELLQFLDRNHFACKVYIVGRVYPPLAHMANELRRIQYSYVSIEIEDRFLPKEQLFGKLKECHVLLAPSLQDSFNVSVLEAMAMGVVPITTVQSGISEIIESGKEGLVVNICDKDFGVKVLDFLTALSRDCGLREEIAIKASEKASHFTCEKIMPILLQQISRLSS